MVYVVDAMMGSGKTSSIINMINNANPDKHFIYITPYLDEASRIATMCESKNFRQPTITAERYRNGKIRANKINGIRRLIKKERNISTTHALFSHFDMDIADLCQEKHYTLIMDEVANVVQAYDEITSDDVLTLRNQFVDIDENCVIHWKDAYKNYNGKYNKEKILCDMGCLTLHGKQMFIWMFPVKIFQAFDDVYLLTYMFDSQIQKYYYDYYGINYTNLYVEGDNVENYELTTDKTTCRPLYNYKELIHISDNDKMNAIGDEKNALSLGWYRRSKADHPELLKRIKANSVNFFNNITKSHVDNNIWTVYKDYENDVAGKGYKGAFVPCNMRATNQYANRHTIAYLINFYMNPTLSKFFEKNKIKVNEEGYALSEMIQFIWRSAVRKGEPVNLYLPSRRMRTILTKWLDEVEKEHLDGQEK